MAFAAAPASSAVTAALGSRQGQVQVSPLCQGAGRTTRSTLCRNCSSLQLNCIPCHAPPPSNAFRVSRSKRQAIVVRAVAPQEFGPSGRTAELPRAPPACLERVTKWTLFLSWIPVILISGAAHAAAAESIGSSSLGLRVAEFLRGSGWADEAIVFTIAMLPVLELRGALPVSYWLQLEPWKGSILAVLGNMVPVPLILLYLGKLSDYLSGKSPGARTFFQNLFERTRKKAGPIEEFKWLGLMLFVAVPFPGTGAWSGAIAAYILGMPFWNAIWANFFGVVIAGILVNLLVSLGLKSALIVGVVLFLASTFVWSLLRSIRSPAGEQQTP